MNLKKLTVLVVLMCTFHVYYSIDILSKFHQSDYHIRNLRIEITYVNKEVMHTLHAIGYKYNRTVTAVKAAMQSKIDLKNQTEIVLQAYKRASNEYRLFPIRFQVNICKSIKANVLGIKDIENYGNFTRCNWKKNTLYHAHGFVVDDSHLPPYIPSGEFKNIIDVMQFKDKLATIEFYLEIYRPEVKNYN